MDAKKVRMNPNIKSQMLADVALGILRGRGKMRASRWDPVTDQWAAYGHFAAPTNQKLNRLFDSLIKLWWWIARTFWFLIPHQLHGFQDANTHRAGAGFLSNDTLGDGHSLTSFNHETVSIVRQIHAWLKPLETSKKLKRLGHGDQWKWPMKESIFEADWVRSGTNRHKLLLQRWGEISISWILFRKTHQRSHSALHSLDVLDIALSYIKIRCRFYMSSSDTKGDENSKRSPYTAASALSWSIHVDDKTEIRIKVKSTRYEATTFHGVGTDHLFYKRKNIMSSELCFGNGNRNSTWTRKQRHFVPQKLPANRLSLVFYITRFDREI